MDSLLRDLKFSVRSLVKHPGFAAVAVLTLALGIAANTTIFSTVDALLLHPFSFSNQDRLKQFSRFALIAGKTPAVPVMAKPKTGG